MKSHDQSLGRIRSLAKLIQFCKEICTTKQVAESSVGDSSASPGIRDPLWELLAFFNLHTKSGNLRAN